jgi:hypothetical protein
MKPTDEGKGEMKSVKGEEVYSHTDFSESSLESHWYQPLCDYPWTRDCIGMSEDSYFDTRQGRMAPHPSLEFYCVPVTTHLCYPELYPDSWHAGMAYHVEYWP